MNPQSDPSSSQSIMAEESFPSRRSSSRPKPSLELLKSSPPPIKFYESTRLRKATTGTPKPKTAGLKPAEVKDPNSSSKARTMVTSYELLDPLTDSTVSSSSSFDLFDRLPSPLTLTPPVTAAAPILKLRFPLGNSSRPSSPPMENSFQPPKRKTPNPIIKPDSKASSTRIVKLKMTKTELPPHPPAEPSGSGSSVGPSQQTRKPATLVPLAPKQPSASASTSIPVLLSKLNLRLVDAPILPQNEARKALDSKTLITTDTSAFVMEYEEKKPLEANGSSSLLGNSNPKGPLHPKNSAPKNLLYLKKAFVASPSPPPIVNEDNCASCGGAGNFICCDSCPRSFHFTCVEPPMDPSAVPDEDWFCCECQWKRQGEPRLENVASDSTAAKFLKGPDTLIWQAIKRTVQTSIPKCFIPPRRFRYQPKEDLARLSQRPLTTTSLKTPPAIPSAIVDDGPFEAIHLGSTKITFNGITLQAPNIASLKSSTGYCHLCGKFGVGRRALDEEEDSCYTHAPANTRPMLSCSLCPLYWHLDCLDPPMTCFPPPALEQRWLCPVHLNEERCLALDLIMTPEMLAKGQSTYLLPESAIRLQFAHKLERLRAEKEHSRPNHEQRQEIEHDPEELQLNRDYAMIPVEIKEYYARSLFS